MTLGPIRFSVAESAYQELTRRLAVRIARLDRAGGSAARQFLGSDETIEISGVVYPGWRGATRIDDLFALARRQQPQMLTDGRGRVWGRWAVETVEAQESVHLANGAPQRQAFRLSLGAYGEDVTRGAGA